MQTEAVVWQAFAASVPVGLLCAAILVVNNVRDLETDRRAGKRTLAVRMGRGRTRVLFAAMIAVAYLSLAAMVVGLSWWTLLPLLTVPLALRLIDTVRTRTDGPSLNGALAQAGLLELAFCVLLAAGMLAS